MIIEGRRAAEYIAAASQMESVESVGWWLTRLA